MKSANAKLLPDLVVRQTKGAAFRELAERHWRWRTFVYIACRASTRAPRPARLTLLLLQSAPLALFFEQRLEIDGWHFKPICARRAGNASACVFLILVQRQGRCFLEISWCMDRRPLVPWSTSKIHSQKPLQKLLLYMKIVRGISYHGRLVVVHMNVSCVCIPKRILTRSVIQGNRVGHTSFSTLPFITHDR